MPKSLITFRTKDSDQNLIASRIVSNNRGSEFVHSFIPYMIYSVESKMKYTDEQYSISVDSDWNGSCVPLKLYKQKKAVNYG